MQITYNDLMTYTLVIIAVAELVIRVFELLHNKKK